MLAWKRNAACALVAVLGLAAGLAAGEGGKDLRIVFIPKVIHPWYDVVQDGANAAAGELKKIGYNVEVKFDAPPTADLSEQIRKIESYISSRPDGLAIASLDPAANAQIINDAIAAGINTIAFDTDSPTSARPLYIGHNQDEQDGFDLGEVLAEKIGGKGKVAILSGSLTAPNHVGRVNGFKKSMARHPDIRIVFDRPDNDDLQKAVELTENALQANPDLAGVFGCNASNPIGAARAVKSAGLAGKVVIVGMDDLPEALELIKEGVIAAVKAQKQWEIGYWGVYYMVGMNRGLTFPPYHPTGSRLITRDDL
ncbi:MAG: substrate-binding domain-containing protein [Planctomycetota bacterium]|jgi:ribose transport system substrate-binding protein|nr:substrate-binding domain-containing protein [Planctomycetota bacterium]